MRLFLIGLTSISLLFSVASCNKRTEEAKEDDELIVYETPAKDALGEEIDALANADTIKNVKKTTAKVSTLKKEDAKKLMRYNVVVATLTQQSGVDKLSKSFDKAGIFYFVVKDRSGYYMFVVGSSDSLEDAIADRKEFLLQATLDKTRKQIWNQFDIEVTDAYIMERR